MALLEYFSENPASFWFAIGALALVIELVVLGMSTIVLFLAGLGSLLTALLIYLGASDPHPRIRPLISLTTKSSSRLLISDSDRPSSRPSLAYS